MTLLERTWRGGRNDWRLHLLSVFSVAVAFVCLVAALLVVFNLDAAREHWATTGRASVYLKPNVQRAEISTIERALRASAGVTEIRYVSSEQARAELLAVQSDQLLDALPEDAFPASLEVSLSDEQALERLKAMASKLEDLPAVEAVETYQSWTERLGAVLTGGVMVALVLSLVVFGAVVSVVSSTLRLTLQRRRIEVEVLKLVGATDAYVRRPFVLEGALQGAIGAVLAVSLVALLHAALSAQVDAGWTQLFGFSPTFLPWAVQLGLLLVGGLLGAIAAHASLRKLLLV